MKHGVVFIALLGATSVQAAPFADPFRPPRQLEPARPEPAVNAASRLESLLIAPDRRVAVIDGQQYREGERFGDGRVLRISETEVVIRHADRDVRLTLFPDSAKRTDTTPQGRK